MNRIIIFDRQRALRAVGWDGKPMKTLRSRSAASLAAAAALSMVATPVMAHDRHGWHRHYHHDGIDGGDLLAGLLVVGGIAAIASAASKSSRDEARDEPSHYPGGPDYARPEEQGYTEVPPVQGRAPDSYPGGPSATDSFDAAVDACSAEIEQGERRIGSVDDVRRMEDRYSVEGRLQDGRGFACSVDGAGQIRSVAVDGHAMI